MAVSDPTSRYLSPEEAKRFYDRLGSLQDWQRFYENAAIEDLIAHSAFSSARAVLEFGCGTGKFAARLMNHYLPADARYLGLDLSSTMASLARKRLQPWSERAQVRQSGGSPRIQEPDASFDRFVSIYVLDLLAPGCIEQLLAEAHRLLMPGGRLCLVSLTFGASRLGRVVSRCWQGVWKLNPTLVGGCHPIELLGYLQPENWKPDYDSRVARWGLTSKVVVASAK